MNEISALSLRFIQDHLYEWAYDEAIREHRLWLFFHGTEWPKDAKITVRRPIRINRIPPLHNP